MEPRISKEKTDQTISVMRRIYKHHLKSTPQSQMAYLYVEETGEAIMYFPASKYLAKLCRFMNKEFDGIQGALRKYLSPPPQEEPEHAE